ncbi:MAG: hypothetical protein HQ530_03895 [Parcubacteria group bacterium]|nr:hypothetical protein [Parcubacteria group bacterium]
MPDFLDTTVVVALAAAGKSESRRDLRHASAQDLIKRFHMGSISIQIDDFPYVNLMRLIDEALMEMELERVYFKAADQGFRHPHNWGTLINLINEDYADLLAGSDGRPKMPESAAEYMLNRLQKASEVNGVPRFGYLDDRLPELYAKLEKHCTEMIRTKQALFDLDLNNATIVIEFARGYKKDAGTPFPDPFGYQYSLRKLSTQILDRASIVYIWVTPKQSRQKNLDRAIPGKEGDDLHHCVPKAVMEEDYGSCDMMSLREQSEKPGTITVVKDGETYHVPIGVFDNRSDLTSFLHKPEAKWTKEELQTLGQELEKTMNEIWTTIDRLTDEGYYAEE